MEYTKKNAVSIAIKCANEYKQKLANTKILIIYKDKNTGGIEHIEVLFYPSNFQHLTGLLLIDENGNVKEKCAVEFYHKCTRKPSLKESEIIFKQDGTTPLKLYTLPYLMDITKITKICGDYDHSKEVLEADIVLGGVNFVIGVSQYEDSEDEYFPRTGMMEDIRNVTKNPSQVLAIFQKPINQKDKYEDIKYVAKGINLNTLTLPVEIDRKISLKYYIHK